MKPDEFGATGKLEGGVFKPYASELFPAQDEIQPEGADIQELLDANLSLKEGLDLVNTELESTQSDFIRYQNDLPGLKARVAELEAGALGEAAADLGSAVQNNAQAIKEMTFADTAVVISPATPAPAEPVTTEPDKASKPAKPAKGGTK